MALNLLSRFIRSVKSAPPATTHDDSGNTIIPFLSGAELMADRNRQVFIARFASLVSLPQQHFQQLYVATLQTFAEFVQQLPASEAHHHAGLGGLLNHSLEVAEKALALRRGFLLPPDADPSVVSRQADLWSYAVFSAALCHDIGKAVVDQTVHRFGARRQSIGVWNPWRGPMTDTAFYRVTFVRNREYGRHQLVGPFVARTIIPDAAIDWLGSQRDLASAWVACLSGSTEFAGPLATIVSQADALSTRENLGATDARMPSATQVPLHEKLLMALRTMLDNGEVTLNRPGAVGFTTETDLWLVSKRCLDLMRVHLIDEGHGGVPSKNDRFMDELQQFGICIPNGERAIWRARIRLPNFDHELTLLRFPLATLWPDPSSRPAPLDGSVEVSDGPANTQTAVPAVDTHAEGPPAFVLPPIVEPDVVEELDVPQTIEPQNQSLAAVDPQADTSVPTENEPDDFMAWLREGLQTGALKINTADAFIHVVPEGLFMVSPRVFKIYIGPSGNWHHLQNRFFRAKLHRRNGDRTNIIRYKVQGKRSSSIIKGVLLPDPARTFQIDLPDPNKHLELVSAIWSHS